MKKGLLKCDSRPPTPQCSFQKEILILPLKIFTILNSTRSQSLSSGNRQVWTLTINKNMVLIVCVKDLNAHWYTYDQKPTCH
uniref:Uncharacterized protein n=1 Tax=Physcomitrium patens TaxID=3218 RepID=A0A2K1KEC0_PHYPA|nr:hypothetical protein PHYPA_008500 [Physcomitrium patens]